MKYLGGFVTVWCEIKGDSWEGEEKTSPALLGGRLTLSERFGKFPTAEPRPWLTGAALAGVRAKVAVPMVNICPLPGWMASLITAQKPRAGYALRWVLVQKADLELAGPVLYCIRNSLAGKPVW